MASDNIEALFVEDVDQELRLRHVTSNPVAPTSPGGFSDGEYFQEDAPLLDSTRGNYGSANGDGYSHDNNEWTGLADFKGLPWWKQPSVFWLLPPFLLFTIAFGGIIVPKINLIMDLVCEEYYATQGDPISAPMDPGQDRCQIDVISSRSSLFLLYGSVCSGILAAITSPKLGHLSDRYGRTRFMILNTFGALLGEILTVLAAKFPETVHVNWILVGYCLDGICGSFIVGMALAHSYASDCVSPQRRNTAFSYFHACLFTGVAIGPALAGYIIEERKKYVSKTDAVLLVFYIALCAHVIFILFLAFCIPESVSKKRQTAAREKYKAEMERLGPSADWTEDWVMALRNKNIFTPLKMLWPTGPGASSALRRNLVVLAAVDTIVSGVAMGAMGVVLVYTRRQFGWQELESGRFATLVSSCRVFALVVVLPVLARLVRGKEGIKRIRQSGSDMFDLSVIRVAIIFDALGFLGYTVARKGELFALSGALAAIGGVGAPVLGAALTKHVPQDQVGQLLGATGLLHAIARVVGPTIFNSIYSATVGSFRQTVFACLTATFGVAFVVSWFIKPHVYVDEPVRFRDDTCDEDEA